MEESVPGTIKKSPSWRGEYAHFTPNELSEMAKKGDKKAVDMLKLFRDQDRLLNKYKNKK